MKNEGAMKRKTFLFLVLMIPSAIMAIPPNELPFGAYMLNDFSDSSIAKLRNELGFNIFYHYQVSDSILQLFNNHSMQYIMGSLGSDSRAPEKYSYAHYAFLEVGTSNPDPDVRFYGRGPGSHILDSTWVSDSSDVLIGMDSRFYPPDIDSSQRVLCMIDRCYEGGYVEQGVIPWYLEISLKINILADSSAVLGWIEGWPAPSLNADIMPDAPESGWTTINIGAITGAQFTRADSFYNLNYQFFIPDTIYFRNNGGYDHQVLPDSEPNGGGAGFNLRIHTTGARTVTVDWVKIYEQQGLSLMNNGPAVNEINSYLGDHNTPIGQQTIYGYYFRDEPVFSNYDVFGKIAGLIKDTYSSWEPFTMNGTGHPYRSYLSRSGESLIDVDNYPLNVLTSYTGYSLNDNSKFQNAINAYAQDIDFMRQQATDVGKPFWLTPQAFWDLGDANNAPWWRKPTPSELWCLTSISLCYGVDGILYWKYDPDARFPGFRMRNQQGELVPSDLYGTVRDKINPYIKAIDSTYMGLRWLRAFPYYEYNSAPTDAFVKNVEPLVPWQWYNWFPDLGWFHVGEFNGPQGDAAKYFMIVNRNCSKDYDDPTEAWPLKVFLELKSSNLNLGNYVYINEVGRTGPNTTTYTTANANGYIPYTLFKVLKAGGARLCRIRSTQRHDLIGRIETDLIYQGTLNITGDITIPRGETLRIEGPSEITIDDNYSIMLERNAALIVEGFDSNTVSITPAKKNGEQ